MSNTPRHDAAPARRRPGQALPVLLAGGLWMGTSQGLSLGPSLGLSLALLPTAAHAQAVDLAGVRFGSSWPRCRLCSAWARRRPSTSSWWPATR